MDKIKYRARDEYYTKGEIQCRCDNVVCLLNTDLNTSSHDPGCNLPHSYRTFTSKTYSSHDYFGSEALEDGGNTYEPEDEEGILRAEVIGDKDEDAPLGRWLSDDEIEDSVETER